MTIMTTGTTGTTGTNARRAIPGSNQAHGPTASPCPDHWHCTYPDKTCHDCPRDGFAETGSTCPSCGAIMMPGGAVTPVFHVEYRRRIDESICLRSRGGVFLCTRRVTPETRAAGACLCPRHDR